MPWVGPPQEVRRRVESILGDGIYEKLAASWEHVLLVDHNLKLTQWYRSPQEILEERRTNPRAALYSQHGLGLAVDVTPSSVEARSRVIAAARAEGFATQTYAGSRHVHIQAIGRDAWARSPLQAYLRGLLAPLLNRGG